MKGNSYWRDPFSTSMIMGGRVITLESLMVSPYSGVRCFSDWGGMEVGGNLVLVDAAVSFHHCYSESSVECGVYVRHRKRQVIWGRPIRCSLGLNSWCHLYWLNGWVPTMTRTGEIPEWLHGQPTPFVQLHLRISELWFLCHPPEATLGKMEVAFERLEMWMPPTQLFCFYVRFFDEFWLGPLWCCRCHALPIYIEWSWN